MEPGFHYEPRAPAPGLQQDAVCCGRFDRPPGVGAARPARPSHLPFPLQVSGT